jgi:integrase
MRQGELLALHWCDVDFAGGFIRVDRNLVRGKLTSPKNHQRRRVDMSAQLAAELLDLRRRERARSLKEDESVPEVVFASDAGGLLDEANVRHVYARILTAAGLRHLKFHGLRHT